MNSVETTDEILSIKSDGVRERIFFTCKHCPISFEEQATCEQHERTHVATETNTICKFCGEDLDYAWVLKDHERTVHADLQPNPQCAYCHKIYQDRRGLERHEVMHTDQYKCYVCGKSFRELTHLRRHELLHTATTRATTPVKPFKCSVCPKLFVTLRNVQRHESKHRDKPFACKYCTRCFVTEKLCDNHEKKEHDKEIKCQVCHKSFFAAWHLRKHKRTHAGEKLTTGNVKNDERVDGIVRSSSVVPNDRDCARDGLSYDNDAWEMVEIKNECDDMIDIHDDFYEQYVKQPPDS